LKENRETEVWRRIGRAEMALADIDMFAKYKSADFFDEIYKECSDLCLTIEHFRCITERNNKSFMK